MSGEIILLSNKKTVAASPLYWKSGVYVAKDYGDKILAETGG